MKKIIIIILLLTLIGCKTKKKVTERTHEKIELSEIKKIVDSTKKEVKKNILNKNKSEVLKITENKDVELTQADPNKEIIVIDSRGSKTIYKGANVIIRDKKIKESKIDTSSSDILIVEKDNSIKTDNSKTTTKTEIKKRTSDSFVKGISPAIGFGIGLGLLVILYLVYKRFT
tara:strand:+ start:2640 stop:3158 length:519 start_codon:yes stop_codon:yes gene_type:complete